MSDLLPVSDDQIRQSAEFGRKMWAYWLQIRKALGGGKSRILFTGMEGVGKTTLFDFMTGKGYERGYKPPGTSTGKETGTLKDGKKSAGLIVVPGQQSAPRWLAVADTILGKSPPDGIVHVTANGFATIREDASTEMLQNTKRQKSLEGLLKYLRDREVTDLREVCCWIRQAHRRHRKPMWLLLAVNKYDLYANDLAVPDAYYPGGRGEVVQLLDDLTKQVGADNFHWHSATACASLSPFNWKSTEVVSALTFEQRDTLIEELVKRVLSLSSDRR